MNAIQSANDEYLTGLTNKGTVKRAYKDMETAEISAEYGESEIIVNVGEEKCDNANISDSYTGWIDLFGCG